jgi:ferredoxin
VLGDRMDDFRLDEFRLPGENLFSERMPALVTGRLSRFVTETPKPLRDKCVACGTCAKVCPRQAITIREGLARVDTGKCIRCFCCDELCEHGAVGVRKPLLMRLARTGG